MLAPGKTTQVINVQASILQLERNVFDKNLPGFKINQLGGTIGGPLGSRKGPKTFFFADYQGTRTRQGLTYVSSVPTAAFRTGDFSAAPQEIYDPLTQVSLEGGGYPRSPFPGNVIPTNRVDRSARTSSISIRCRIYPESQTNFFIARRAGSPRMNSTAGWIGRFRTRTTVSFATATHETTP